MLLFYPKKIINSLIIGGNPTNLPEGFKAIIPKGTKLLDYELKDGLLKINFSKEFLLVDLENEEKMLEALVYSLTTIKDVKKIMIFVEGEHLRELPKTKIKLDLYLDRSIGINKIININNIAHTSMTTVYYLSNTKNSYYIPISYIFLRMDYNPETTLWINLAIILLSMFPRLYICKNILELSINDYIKDVIIKISIPLIFLMLLFYILMPVISTMNIIATIAVQMSLSSILIFTTGFTRLEKSFILKQLKQRIK